ncbi:MAG TPA: methyltransferase domain-containing protein [Selenomonadales bacterium]|nr:methyltransferase domain-containing protein [Selenomonadales bacterium]
MSYLSRIRTRVGEEGYWNTFKYGTLVGLDSLRGFARDSYLDLRYSGKVLHGNQASEFKALGANDVYHTDYGAMPFIFGQAAIAPEDVLVDVGCGKGRVINYWLSCSYANRIVGLELDPAVAASTARQFAARPNVAIVPGDAIANLPPDGTVFYFYNPFTEEKVGEFERTLRKRAGKKAVKVVYYNPKSLHAFDNPHWSIQTFDFAKDFGVKRWGRLNKYHDLAVITKTNPAFAGQVSGGLPPETCVP